MLVLGLDERGKTLQAYALLGELLDLFSDFHPEKLVSAQRMMNTLLYGGEEPQALDDILMPKVTEPQQIVVDDSPKMTREITHHETSVAESHKMETMTAVSEKDVLRNSKRNLAWVFVTLLFVGVPLLIFISRKRILR